MFYSLMNLPTKSINYDGRLKGIDVVFQYLGRSIDDNIPVKMPSNRCTFEFS